MVALLVRLSLIAGLLLTSSIASAEIIRLDIRYEVVGGPNDGDVFFGRLEIDDSDPNFVPGGMIPWFNYKSNYSTVGDWDSNSDILQGGILLWLGADLVVLDLAEDEVPDATIVGDEIDVLTG